MLFLLLFSPTQPLIYRVINESRSKQSISVSLQLKRIQSCQKVDDYLIGSTFITGVQISWFYMQHIQQTEHP